MLYCGDQEWHGCHILTSLLVGIHTTCLFVATMSLKSFTVQVRGRLNACQQKCPLKSPQKRYIYYHQYCSSLKVLYESLKRVLEHIYLFQLASDTSESMTWKVKSSLPMLLQGQDSRLVIQSRAPFTTVALFALLLWSNQDLLPLPIKEHNCCWNVSFTSIALPSTWEHCTPLSQPRVFCLYCEWYML